MGGQAGGDVREIDVRLPALVLGDAEPPAGLVGHIDVQLHSPQQRRGLHVLLSGLNRTHQRTEDGNHVDKATQAVRWLLERIAEGAEKRAAWIAHAKAYSNRDNQPDGQEKDGEGARED